MSAFETIEQFEPRPEPRRRGTALTDRTSLEAVGLVLAAITAAVVLTAVFVVYSHVAKDTAGQSSPSDRAAMSQRR